MIKMSCNMNVSTAQSDNIFILLTTENGNGYDNADCQQIVTIGYNEKTIQDIFNIFFILSNTSNKNKLMLRYNIHDYDMTVMNMLFLGNYEDVVDYTKTHIISIDVESKAELSTILINIFETMQTCKDIKQLLYSRRKKYNNKVKVFFFLVKVFIDKNIEIENIKSNILRPDIILNHKMKLKVNDVEINKQNKNEIGIKKNNWINI